MAFVLPVRSPVEALCLTRKHHQEIVVARVIRPKLGESGFKRVAARFAPIRPVVCRASAGGISCTLFRPRTSTKCGPAPPTCQFAVGEKLWGVRSR